MIRYVLAALLTVALIAVAVPAIDWASTRNTERQVDASIAELEEATTSLVENEEVSPPGHPDPQRVVPIALPRDTLTTTPVDHFEIVPHQAGFSTVRYVLEDGTTRETTIDVPIRYGDPDALEPLELGGTQPQDVRLVLVENADGDPVVVANPVE